MHKIFGCHKPCLWIRANLAWQSPPTPNVIITSWGWCLFTYPTCNCTGQHWMESQSLQRHTFCANSAIDLPLSGIMCPIITCREYFHLSSQCSTRMCQNLSPGNRRHLQAAIAWFRVQECVADEKIYPKFLRTYTNYMFLRCDYLSVV